MIMNLGPIGEKFNALKHILIAPTGSTTYTKIKDASSNYRWYEDDDEDYWYIAIKQSCKLKVTKDVNSCDIAAVGGGGGGAGSSLSGGLYYGGGGGNGGEVKTGTAELTKGQNYEITIGAGGVGGQYDSEGNISTTAANGEKSLLKNGNVTIISAAGGNCGITNTTTTNNQAIGRTYGL